MAWKRVCSLKDIEENSLKNFEIEGKEICLINSKGKIYAVQEYCTHEDAPLHEGYLEDEILVCPWHAARFDIKTGKVMETPWATDLKSYEVKIENGEVYVNI